MRVRNRYPGLYTPDRASSGYAWVQSFYDGGQSAYRKYASLRVRAVRKCPL